MTSQPDAPVIAASPETNDADDQRLDRTLLAAELLTNSASEVLKLLVEIEEEALETASTK